MGCAAEHGEKTQQLYGRDRGCGRGRLATGESRLGAKVEGFVLFRLNGRSGLGGLGVRHRAAVGGRGEVHWGPEDVGGHDASAAKRGIRNESREKKKKGRFTCAFRQTEEGTLLLKRGFRN